MALLDDVGKGQAVEGPEIRNVVVSSLVLLWCTLTIYVFPLFIGTRLGGFERADVLSKYSLYIGIGSGAIIGSLIIIVIVTLLFKNADRKLNGLLIHSPERTPIGEFGWVRNPFKFFLVFLVLFSFAGLFFTARSQSFFGDVPTLEEQQFTEAADVFFSVYPASTAETLLFAFVCMLILVFFGFWWNQRGLNADLYYLVSIFICATIGLIYGIWLHFLRYSATDTSLQSVAAFWILSGMLIGVFASVIPALLLHDLNNLFLRLNELFSNDQILFVAGVVVFVIFVLTVLYFILSKDKKRREV